MFKAHITRLASLLANMLFLHILKWTLSFLGSSHSSEPYSHKGQNPSNNTGYTDNEQYFHTSQSIHRVLWPQVAPGEIQIGR